MEGDETVAVQSEEGLDERRNLNQERKKDSSPPSIFPTFSFRELTSDRGIFGIICNPFFHITDRRVVNSFSLSVTSNWKTLDRHKTSLFPRKNFREVKSKTKDTHWHGSQFIANSARG